MQSLYDYYNALHEALFSTERDLKQAMTSYNYLSISILKTRLLVIADLIKEVGKALANNTEYQPALPEPFAESALEKISLLSFIPAAIKRCVQLECYWLFYSDTPEGKTQYERYHALTQQETSLQEFIEGVARCAAPTDVRNSL